MFVFPELTELEEVLELLPPGAKVEKLAEVDCKKHRFPVYGITIGNPDPNAPVLGMFGGVHGLERIGSRVAIAHLRTLSELLRWDDTIRQLFTKIRLVSIPLINPGGMFLQTRSNPNGVDLMRNAPIQADEVSKYFLVAGHRISPKLPWYRGTSGAPMEIEAQAVSDFVEKHMFQSKASIALDVHSGFGAKDRLWFPYARTTQPFPNLPEVFALKRLLDTTYPNHVYIVEPQAKQYITHGDLWDFLYDNFRLKETQKVFLPLTLELGSWIWVKKNPRQLFSLLGAFNPLLPHRRARALRRHLLFFDFLLRAVCAPEKWAFLEEEKKKQFQNDALNLWYGKAA